MDLMASSNYPRPYGPVQFGPDRVWGTIFVVLYSLMLGVALLIVLGITTAITMAGTPENGAPHFAAPFFGAAFATVAAIFLVAIIGVHIVGAVGIRRSRAWGFWATIILSILSLAGSSGGTCLTIIPLVYSILRLTAVFGPKPT
jgi:hypothetical protein